MSRWTIAAGVIPLAFAAIVSAPAQSQETPAEPDRLLEKWMALYQERAESLDMRGAGDAERRLELQISALLRYTNPVRNVQQHGAIYVWTVEGRPAILGSIWSAIDRMQPDIRRLNFEWHSLSTDDITAEQNGSLLWTSGEPGVEWHDARESGPAAASRPLRLVQMRRIARSLTARIDTEESELRLMDQPIYRYPEGIAGVDDGAVFAFVMGTDPELLVLLEATSSGAGPPQWKIACARFSNWPMQVTLRGREFWSCEKATPNQDRGAFYLRFAVERLPADLEGVDGTTGLNRKQSGSVVLPVP
jgi:hypothetical protein